jgi:hypothetical protein
MEVEILKSSKWENADIHGDCPVCGKYVEKIKAGELAPCFQWQRVNFSNDDTATTKSGCTGCGGEIEPTGKRGRPPVRCEACR